MLIDEGINSCYPQIALFFDLTMKKMQSFDPNTSEDDLLPEYNFDYSKARPNRFAQMAEEPIVVLLDPDVARVFKNSETVNTVLRALIETMPSVQ